MKKKKLNSGQLGFFSTALMSNLFPKPMKGELLVDENTDDQSCILYFVEEYHNKLDAKIRDHYYKGAFAKSNAEAEWKDLMVLINTAEETSDDVSTFVDYWLSSDPEDEKKHKIRIDTNKLSEIINSERPIKNGDIRGVLKNLGEDLSAVYVGHIITISYDGYIKLERDIIKPTYSSTIELAPALKIFNKYQTVIERLEIKVLENPDTIRVSIFLEN